MNHQVKFKLTAKQRNNFRNGGAVQLSHAQLNNQSRTANHDVDVHLNLAGRKKLEHAMRNNKGFRLNSEHHEGGNIFNDIKKTANKAVKTVKSTYKTVNKAALKSDIGSAIQGVKNAIPKEVVSSTMKAGLMASGMDEHEADTLASSATGSLYAVDFSKSLKGQGNAALNGAATGAIQAQTGSGFWQDVGNVAKTVASNKDVQKFALNTAKDGYKKYQKSKKVEGSSLIGGGFWDDLKNTAMTVASNPEVQKFALNTAKEGYSSYQKNKKTKKTSGGSFVGNGVSGGRPAKGSQEAKDRMARIRGMKKTGGSFNGGSFRN